MHETNGNMLFGPQNVSREPLAQQVASQISQLIQDEKLSSGDKLPNEFELAEMLQVGRGTIREAVKLLVSRNVLVIRRGLGTFVANKPGVVDDPLGFAYVQDQFRLAMDLLEIRTIFEPAVAEMAALHATPEDIEKIERLCNQVEEQMLKGLPHLELDIQFHTQIAQSTNNTVVPQIIPLITSSIGIFIDMTKTALVQETIETHRDITNAIKSRNPEGARTAMLQHLKYNEECMKKEQQERNSSL